ncbi:nucleotidyltransferase-like protein [Paenibacillus sediminis]|uniref:Nucleotidyltransferase-like domain-containing protein n=1 Tax=Paenibacillus sediminis TaxID=664909 RepID=A0ABS4H3J6_9BACL|nr:hypothetical protein [Paenibacillus sediminis]
MELTNLSFIGDRSLGSDAIGAVSYRRHDVNFHSSLLQDFDILILVVCECEHLKREVEHLIDKELRYQVLYVSLNYFKHWIVSGENRDIVEYLLQGTIIWDERGVIRQMKEKLFQFDHSLREQKMFSEFAKFMRMYVEAKRYIQDGHILDAYHSVLEALHHWARIELIKQNVHPETTVWNQLRNLNVAVYKLYEELAGGNETLEKRVQLAIIACEFSVMSKMEECSSILLTILRSRSKPWAVQELAELPELQHVSAELPMLLRKLVYRSLVNEEVRTMQRETELVREIRYWAL